MMMTTPIESILFVCTGNICRSPAAEAVFRKALSDAGLNIKLDSAGTIGYHQGNLPDIRARAAGEKRGYSFEGITARQVTAEDFEKYDLILAADVNNLNDLTLHCPLRHRHKLKLILSYSNSSQQEVPDPYYGDSDNFEQVLDLLEDSAHHFLIDLQQA